MTRTTSKKPFIFAIVSVILLLPSVLALVAALSLITQSINTFQAIQLYSTGDPKLMAGALAQELVTQILLVILLLPGIIVATIVKFKYQYAQVWYKNCLRLYAACLLLLLPLGTLISLYLLFLSEKKNSL